MSEQANLQTIKKAYEAFGRGDIQTILSLLTDDVEWTLPGPSEVPYAGKRHGHAGTAEFFRLLAQADEVLTFEPRDFLAQGDLVVVLGRYSARVRSTGRVAESDWVHVFKFRGDLVASWHEYYDTAAYAEAYRTTANA